MTCNKTEDKITQQPDSDADIIEITEEDVPGIVVCRWNSKKQKWSRFLFGSAIEVSADFLSRYHNDVVGN